MLKTEAVTLLKRKNFEGACLWTSFLQVHRRHLIKMAKVVSINAADDLRFVVADSARCFAYFYADWCLDCTRSTPLVESVFSELPGCKLFMVNVGEKTAFRDKHSPLRVRLADFKLSCLPTVLCLSYSGNDKSNHRLAEALEQCANPAEGKALVSDFVKRCLGPPAKGACPFPFILLHDPQAGVRAHPVKVALTVALLATCATLLIRRR